jgi:hypothetical protein
MNPELEIYDITGKRTAVIQLDMDHIPVTRRFIREYKKSRVDSMREESASYQEHRADHLKEVGKADFSILFGDHLPYYNSILVDGEGNILIFFPAVCLDRCPIKVRIYSGSGDFCCETEIDSGDYELIIDPRRRHMCFTPDGLFALVQPKRSEDFLLRLIKVTY